MENTYTFLREQLDRFTKHVSRLALSNETIKDVVDKCISECDRLNNNEIIYGKLHVLLHDETFCQLLENNVFTIQVEAYSNGEELQDRNYTDRMDVNDIVEVIGFVEKYSKDYILLCQISGNELVNILNFNI